MKRPRPYIPLEIQLAVALRQLAQRYPGAQVYFDATPLRRRLRITLNLLFGDGIAAQLDHDPALILRPLSPRTGKYTPDANDPAFLIWREKKDHLQKTIGRRADAERTVTTKGSDIWLKTKFRRLEAPPKRKTKIPSRGFPKQKRTLRS